MDDFKTQPETPVTTSTTTPSSSPIIDTSGAVKWNETQTLIADLEKLCDSDVLVLYISLNSILSDEEVDYIYNHLSSIKNKREKLTLFLFGPGGSGVAAAKIVYLIRNYYKNFEVIIPSQAASACTMLALGAEKILMGPLSSLSAIDTSISNHPLAPRDKDNRPVRVEIAQIQKFIELLNSGMTSSQVDDVKKSPYTLLVEHVHPLVIGTIQRSLSLSRMLTTDILKTHMDDAARIETIVCDLNDKFPTHGYPISLSKARELKIQVDNLSEELNHKSLRFLKLLDKLSLGGKNETGGIQTRFERSVIIETINMRTVYAMERRYSLNDTKSWTFLDSTGRYIILAPQKEETGIIKIKIIDPSEID